MEVTKMSKYRNLITLEDLTDSELYDIVTRGVDFATGRAKPEKVLAGKTTAIYFRKTSTRTRCAFSVAALKLGSDIVLIGPNDLQENTGETIEDTAKILSSMFDCLVARTAASQSEMEILAAQERMAVINAMSTEEHPTQGLTDLTTMKQHFGEISGLDVLYLGEGNNSAVALTLALSRYPKTKLHLMTPPGYGLNPQVFELAQHHAQVHGSEVFEHHDMNKLPKSDIDVVYTTRWQTTGTNKPDPLWRKVFYPFRVTEAILERYPNAIFMHDLPAHRGEDVEAIVIDGPKSIVFTQAENKMNSAMAVLEHCLTR
jgi:ornithine carbamoyltransferase